MTFLGLNSREPAKRASSLYHLGVRVSHEAKTSRPLTADQDKVVSIFLHEVKKAHICALQEVGYESPRQSA